MFLSTLCLIFFLSIQQAVSVPFYEVIEDKLYPGIIEYRVMIKQECDVIGRIAFIKFSFVSKYVIYDFYVSKTFRGKGYGSALMRYTMNMIKKKKGRCIYIQPGPFELDENGDSIELSKEVYQKKISQLIELYKHYNFVSASWPIRFLSHWFYKIIGIPEDAHYLMVCCDF